MTTSTPELAYDERGAGPLVLMLPGAGDLRSEYRFVADRVAGAGYRVVTADLPGHGDSPVADAYTVETTAASIIRLIQSLGCGPAAVVATSFAPAAAVWAAVDRPDLVSGIVAISPHLDEDRSPKGRALSLALRGLMAGPWAGAAWAGLYRSWYKASPPADLDTEIARMRGMLSDPDRRRAVTRTLTASRDGMADRIAALDCPALTVFGGADDHFADPAAEGREVSERLRGDLLVVDGVGHYPHVERPDVVAGAVLDFLAR